MTRRKKVTYLRDDGQRAVRGVGVQRQELPTATSRTPRCRRRSPLLRVDALWHFLTR
jgi:hypothetical protein|eukprot:COSAG02_NODE_7105_length_3184_cov_2.983144_2_plen_57_part_00